nr:peptidoglycan-binding domain-containing protein [Micromonospora sp. DSM 115978]
MKLNRLKKIAVASVVGLVAGLAPVAGPASAALDYCNRSYVAHLWVGTVEGSFKEFHLPNYVGSYYHTGSCQIRANGSSPRDGVMSIQRSLRYCYGKSIAIDGAFGSRTAAALREVQKSLNLTADGIWGPATAKAMKWSVNTPDLPNCYRGRFDNNMYWRGVL